MSVAALRQGRGWSVQSCSRQERPRRVSVILFLTLLLLAPAPRNNGPAAQTPSPPGPYEGGITLELWTTEDRIIHGEDSTAEVRLLQEARYTLSGIVYGWEFSYIPGDASRRVSERFTVDPIGQVPWGSAGLRVRDIRAVENTLHGQIDYTFTADEKARLSYWASFTTARSSGIGTAPLLEGTEGKIAAIENAIHRAVREYLRSRYPNRPREARGEVALIRPPRIRTVSGEYEARVTVSIDLQDVRDYLVF